MIYIVVDFEFNQSFDFQNNCKGESNPLCPFEIIQIGAVKLDKDFKIIGNFDKSIKPVIYPRLHPYVRDLISLDQKTLSNSPGFLEVFNEFLQFCGENCEDYVFCFWGDADIKSLFHNLHFYNINLKIVSKRFINIQSITSKHLKSPLGKLIGLKSAIEMLELEITVPFHDAFNDALYTAKIFQFMKNKNLPINTYKFPPNKVKTYSKNSPNFNLKQLYAVVEKDLGRKLTLKEKEIYKKVYLMGRCKNLD